MNRELTSPTLPYGRVEKRKEKSFQECNCALIPIKALLEILFLAF